MLTTPLLALLAERGSVDVVTTPQAASILAHHPAVRTLIPYDKHGRDRGPAGFSRVARRLRALGGPSTGPDCYASAYLAQGSLRSAALAVVSGARERVGFATSTGRWLHTRSVPYLDSEHHATRLLRLATTGVGESPRERPRPRLYPGAAEQRAVDALLEGGGIGRTSFVALAPGSVWATKRWPHFPTLAAALVARGIPLVLVGGLSDTESAQRVEDKARQGVVVNAVGKLSLLGSAALLARAATLVTNDSAPLHLASAMGTPTIAVFGPTIPGFGFGPLAPRAAVAEHLGLACRPCDRHGPRRCPLGHWRCMREIDSTHVEELVMTLLSGGPSMTHDT
ncbi:MAG: glycosyltransferase family 9 protein [Gemmatimonadaceae bacterium]